MPVDKKMGMMEVYAIAAETIRQLDPAPLCRHMPERMKRAERYRFEKDRLLCIGGGEELRAQAEAVNRLEFHQINARRDIFSVLSGREEGAL